MARITDTGVETRDLAGWRSYFEELFRTTFGADLSLDPESVAGQLVGLLAIAWTEGDEVVASMANGMDPATADIAQLLNLGSLLNIERRAATHSTVTCTLAGVAGTTIPADVRVRDDSDGEWALAAAATIGAGGTVDALFRAVGTGATKAAAGAVNRIITVRAGWETVTNAEAATPGVDIEPVETYRHRVEHHTMRNAASMAEAISAAVAEVDGVVSHRVEENDTASAVVRQGISIPARSILVVVQGGAPADIGTAIRATKAAGVPTAGNATVTVLGYDYRFQRVGIAELKVALSIDPEPGFPANGVLQIKNRLASWVGNLDIGETVDLGRIYEALNQVPGYTVRSLRVREDPVRISGRELPASVVLSDFTGVSTGSFSFADEDFAGLDLSTAVDFAGLAALLQAKIRTGSGASGLRYVNPTEIGELSAAIGSASDLDIGTLLSALTDSATAVALKAPASQTMAVGDRLLIGSEVMKVTALAASAAIGTLGAALTDSGTALTLGADASETIEVGDKLRVGTEDMVVTAVTDQRTFTVTRGADGTDAAAHNAGAAVAKLRSSFTVTRGDDGTTAVTHNADATVLTRRPIVLAAAATETVAAGDLLQIGDEILEVLVVDSQTTFTVARGTRGSQAAAAASATAVSALAGLGSASVTWFPDARRFSVALPGIGSEPGASDDFALAAHSEGTGTDVSGLFGLRLADGTLQYARPQVGDRRFSLAVADVTVLVTAT